MDVTLNHRHMAQTERRKNESPDLTILIYRIDELKEQNAELKGLVEAGFVKQESRVATLETRVNGLEIWRAGQDAASKGGSDYMKIILIVLGLLGTALGVIQSDILG